MPGAIERTGGSGIVLAQDDDGTLEIRIPSRGANLFMGAASTLLFLNLLALFAIGFIFLILQKSVLGYNAATVYPMTPTLRRGLPIMILFWLILEWVGFRLLIAITRAAFTTETIRIAGDTITITRTFFRRKEIQTFFREEINGFQLRQDPLGFSPSTLSLVVRGKYYPIAECAKETEREWIISVGNAQLRNIGPSPTP